MHFSRSLLASATVLSFSVTSQARVVRPRDVQVDEQQREVEESRRGLSLEPRHKLVRRQSNITSSDGACTTDRYVNALTNIPYPEAQTFCNIWNEIRPMTTDVDWTPTIYKTESTGTIRTEVATERTTTTEITTETQYITAVPGQRRAIDVAPRINNVAAQVEAIVTSVLESGTEPPVASSSRNSERRQLESSLTYACDCLDFDPTATSTSTNTAPPTVETVKMLLNRRVTETTTRLYTSTITSTITLNQTASQGFPAGSTNSTVDGESSTETIANSASVPFTTSPVTPTVVTSGASASSILNFPPGVARPVATALPFDCPGGHQQRVTNIVGGERYEYMVLCDTSIVTDNELFTKQVAGPTECAAECSFVNDFVQYDICRATTFTAAPGANGGDCLISGPTSSVVTKPGSVTAMLIGVYTGGDNCAAVNFTIPPGNVTVDPRALVATLTSASVSVTTPPYITSAGSGGESSFYTSHGETGTDGIYRYSWQYFYASSSFWYEAFATSWTCTNNVPVTLTVQEPTTIVGGNVTSVYNGVTTIINGTVITVIAGTSTNFFTQGSGAITPSAVPANTTSGGGLYTTASATATQTSNGGEGSEFPSATPGASSGVSSLAGVNGTSIPLVGPTASGGSATFVTSGSSATANSTGGAGTEVGPSSYVQISTLSFMTATSNTTGSGYGESVVSLLSTGTGIPAAQTANSTGSLPTAISATSGGSLQTVGGSNATTFSTGGGSFIVPSGTGASLVATASGAIATSNSTEGAGSGSLAPTSLPISVSGTASGGFSIASSGNTSFFTSTSGGGSVSPLPASINLTTSGLASGASSGSTYTANTTGGFGTGLPSVTPSSNALTIVLGPGSQVTILPSGTIPVVIVPSVNATATGGSANASTSGGTGFTFASGGGGSVFPSNVSVTATASLTASPSLNISSSLVTGFSTSGAAQQNSSGATGTAFTTGATGIVLPSGNISVSETPSLTPTASINGTNTVIGTGSILPASGIFNASISSGTAVSFSTGGTGEIRPTANSTAPLGTSSTGPDFTNSGLPRTGAFSRTTSQPSAGLPSAYSPTNLTSSLGTGQPSASQAPISANSTLPLGTGTTGPEFTNSGLPRTGAFSRSHSSENTTRTLWPGTSVSSPPRTSEAGSSGFPVSSANTTATIPLSTGATITPINSTALAAATTSRPVPLVTGSSSVPAASANTSLAGTGTGAYPIFSSGNLSSTLGTAILSLPPLVTDSASVPVASANSTAAAATGSGYVPSSGIIVTRLVSTSDLPESTGVANSTSVLATGSLPSSGLPLVSANSTSPAGTGSSSIPIASANSSISLSTGAPVGTVSSGAPSASLNSSVPLSSGVSASIGSGILTANSTFGIGTASSAFPTATLNFINSGLPRTGEFSRSRNSSIPLSTGAAATPTLVGTGTSAIPTPSYNASIPFSNTELPRTGSIVASLNATVPLSTGASIVPLGTASSAFASQTANSTNAYATGSSVSSSNLLPASANSTAFFPTGTSQGVASTASLSISLNATIASFLVTGNGSSVPSTTRTVSINGTSEACPTPTPQISVETVLITHTITPEATCAPTGNVTNPFATASSGPGTISYYPGILSTAALPNPTSTPISAPLRRLEGSTATQEQIDAACADPGNIIYNAAFEQGDASSAAGWDVHPEDSFISFDTYPSSTQHTPNGARTGRISSAAAYRQINITQPLTLCPGKQYQFSAFTRQPDEAANCHVEYSIGDKVVLADDPQTSYLADDQFYTAGTSPADVSVDLRIRGWCEGEGGIPRGVNDEGYMVVEFDDLNLRLV